jgi:addiction module RelB/DinJ family antitoxin
MKTTTSLKIDKHVKEEASKLATSLGLSLSTVINGSLQNFISERRMVFSLYPEFNKKTSEEISDIRLDIKKRKNIVGPFSDISDLKKSLLK